MKMALERAGVLHLVANSDPLAWNGSYRECGRAVIESAVSRSECVDHPRTYWCGTRSRSNWVVVRFTASDTNVPGDNGVLGFVFGKIRGPLK